MDGSAVVYLISEIGGIYPDSSARHKFKRNIFTNLAKLQIYVIHISYPSILVYCVVVLPRGLRGGCTKSWSKITRVGGKAKKHDVIPVPKRNEYIFGRFHFKVAVARVMPHVSRLLRCARVSKAYFLNLLRLRAYSFRIKADGKCYVTLHSGAVNQAPLINLGRKMCNFLFRDYYWFAISMAEVHSVALRHYMIYMLLVLQEKGPLGKAHFV